MATVVDVGALMGGAAAARRAMEPGFTGDELHAGLSDLKYIVTNKLQPAVEASPLGPGGLGGRHWHGRLNIIWPSMAVAWKEIAG